MRRLGILGGTFDPIHFGHLDIARAAESALALTELLIVPSYFPPHRPQPRASSYHRFAMVALAIAGHPRWRASDLELQAAASPSFTSATLDRLRASGYAAGELFFIVGADAFADIETWKDYPAIFDRAHFAVVSRPGTAASSLRERLPAAAARMLPVSRLSVPPATTSIFLIDSPTADVSSTAIRARRASGLSIAGLVPTTVQQHIEQHGLYTNMPPDVGVDEASVDQAAGRLHGQN